jgi:AraC-like DNA-binding protein/ligand-binding sensor protein
MTKSPNLIQRRELEPLLLKAYKIARYYEKAVNCAASVMEPDWNTASINFCSLCKQCRESIAQSTEEKACFLMHMEAVKEARRLGGSYIYLCPSGFVFWTSPFYSGERFAGALLSGGVMRVEKRQTMEHFMMNSINRTHREEIEHFLSGVPEKNSDEVKALAQMMLLCAAQISGMGISGLIVSIPESGSTAEIKDEPTESKNLKIENDVYSMERSLLASLRRGDNYDAQKILKELIDVLHKTARGNFQVFRLRAMELAVFLSRAVSNPKDIKEGVVLDTNSRYLKKIGEASGLQEITENLSGLTERISGKIFSFQGVRHFSALRKAERFIWDNYTRKLSLKEIADASGLSAPYFSTIFKEEMRENLSNYLNRLRVEKAASMLATTDMPISEIAADCGFEDQSWFSKIFKKNTGFTPGRYREQGSVFNE